MLTLIIYTCILELKYVVYMLCKSCAMVCGWFKYVSIWHDGTPQYVIRDCKCGSISIICGVLYTEIACALLATVCARHAVTTISIITSEIQALWGESK